MTLGRIGCALAIVSVLCVLTVFFFPAMQGPYSVVHGPVTALLSVRAAAGVRTAIVRAGLGVMQNRVPYVRAGLATVVTGTVPALEFQADNLLAQYDSILRC